MSNLYADIIINISHEALDRVFQYKVPLVLREEIEIGMQVVIPFGRGNKEQTGYVVGLGSQADYDEDKIKSILSISKDSIQIESHLIKLAYWMKDQYGSTIINALKAVLPVKDKIVTKENRTIKLLLERNEAYLELEQYHKKKFVAKARLLEAVLKEGALSYQKAVYQLKVPRSTITGMEKQGVIGIESTQVYRNPLAKSQAPDKGHALNDEQEVILNEFKTDYMNGSRKTYLLHGVTGSGKTEVYIHAILAAVSQKKQAIVLIPEIALTYQTIRRFQQYFGDRVSIMNSRLSKGERFDQFTRAKRGEIDIIIGPRSALFTPFSNLGLIIIDEEHEGTYKSDNAPKYHAREVAIERANMAGASVILGSATPSIESYTKALLGEYVLWKMKKRVNDYAMPSVSVVDLRDEMKKGNRSMFSDKLKALIEDRLAKKEQIMLFINRRGYANFVSCRSCGYVVKCTHCDVSLTYHKDGSLKCHYCGHKERVPTVCPECKTKYIAAFGTGTQKVEASVRKEFPAARVLRMDMDTTKGKSGHESILSAFSKEEADILIGTQMIVKGHDFSKVTLVGVIAADLSLYSNDYRASERTFQLLTQAAGRAGRGEYPGEVVIQTYSPGHYSILAASRQDYESFYDQEITYRRLLKYPPVYQMLVVFIASAKEEEAIRASQALFDALRQKDRNKELTVIGPTEASFSKIKDVYRRIIYIKHLDYELLVKVKDFLEGYIDYSDIFKDSMVLFDFNPMNTY